MDGGEGRRGAVERGEERWRAERRMARTIFWILNSWKTTLAQFSFCSSRAYLRAACLAASSDLAPVTTILPLLKMRAVVFGSRMRMITAANRFGLYSAFRAPVAIAFRSRSSATLHVATRF